jgi:hypothetical protein
MPYKVPAEREIGPVFVPEGHDVRQALKMPRAPGNAIRAPKNPCARLPRCRVARAIAPLDKLRQAPPALARNRTKPSENQEFFLYFAHLFIWREWRDAVYSPLHDA